MGTTTIGNSMKDTQIKPNDIAVILRPNHQSGVEWDGDFEVLVSGFGPVTMGKDDIDKLIAMGVLLASVFPFMEKNADIAHLIMEHCNKFYGEPFDGTSESLIQIKIGRIVALRGKKV